MSKKSIIDNLNNRPLSESLQKLLVLATQTEDSDLVKWVKFELTGYQGSAMTNEDVVPEYREVKGYHADDYHRKFVIDRDDMQFINCTRLRAGVVELEVYQDNGLILKDPSLCKLIQENLNVKVTSFHISASQVQNVLANVKCELIDRLSKLREPEKAVANNEEDIIEIKPNFYGIGLNLNALKRKWFPSKDKPE